MFHEECQKFKLSIFKKVQVGVNVFTCRIKGCSGSLWLPISLNRLARIRTFGPETSQVRFDCGHYHKLTVH